MAEPTKITLRQNGSNQGTLSGTAGQFATLIRESPQNLISQALMQDTGDLERPGKVCDWLLPGWKFDIDYRCDETGRPIEIVTWVLEPRIDERWTQRASDRALLGNKTGTTRLGFAVLLKMFQAQGRFPSRPEEVPVAAVEAIARQIGMSAAAWRSHDWGSRAIA